jgi:Flp pilus assembly protein TadG
MLNDRCNPGTKWKKSTGVITILMAVALPALLAIVGLAIDSARAYGVKANLSAAVDAASLAAARAVSNGEAAATRAANKFFAANFPAGYFGSTPGQPSVSFSYTAEGHISINVSATAKMPTTFLRIVGMDEMDISSIAQTIRRPVDLSFVVDNTTSLTAAAGVDVTQDVIDRSKDFVGYFGEFFDRIALVKYALGAEVPVGFNSARGFSKITVERAIDAFEFGSSSSPHFTNASEGMWRAIDAITTANEPASLRVIVFFTDGAPNTFASSFSFNGGVPDRVGAIRSTGASSGTPYGLWEADKVAKPIASPWEYRDNRGTSLADALAGFPRYYNAHDPDASDFLVINPSHPRRPVPDYNRSRDSARDLYKKINRISRNLPEDMAEYARQNGIFVLTLGLGSNLTQPTGPDDERGEEMLMRMANDPRMAEIPSLASDFRPDEPQGIYCHAVDKDALAPCFADMLAVIIRLTI